MDGTQVTLLVVAGFVIVVVSLVSRATGWTGTRRSHRGGSDASSGALPFVGGDDITGGHHTSHHGGHSGGHSGGHDGGGWGGWGGDSGGGGGDSGGGGGGGGGGD